MAEETYHQQKARTLLAHASGVAMGTLSEAEWHLRAAEVHATLAVADAMERVFSALHQMNGGE